jgi:hypothetical protein
LEAGLSQVADGDVQTREALGNARNLRELVRAQQQIEAQISALEFAEDAWDFIFEIEADAPEFRVIQDNRSEEAEDEIVARGEFQEARGRTPRLPYQYGAIETVAFENRCEVLGNVAIGEVLVGIDPQSEDEAEAAAHAPRSLHQQHPLPAGDGERQITLRQHVAQVGGSFYALG